MAAAGTNGMVITCTGLEERQQNELYLLAQDMQATLLRDKVAALYDTRTTHLVIGRLAKTDKLLCGLAAGVPIVTDSYIRKSKAAGHWLADIDTFDVGREEEQRVGREKVYVPPLQARMIGRQQGGVFRGWRVVVLLEEPRQKEVYRRILELGGARVERWTLQHLRDLQQQRSPELAAISLIVARPNGLMNTDFRHFLGVNDTSQGVPVVSQTYVGDFLTKRSAPKRQMYDVRNPQMWHLAEESWMVGQLEELRLGVWAPQEGEAPPSLQEGCGGSSGGEERGGVEAADIQSPDFSHDELQDDSPDLREDSPEPAQHKRSRRGGLEVQPATAKKRRFDPRRDVEADSGDEIEILTESISGRPLASLTSPSNSGLARLKARAAQLLSQSRDGATPRADRALGGTSRGLGGTPRGLVGTPRGLEVTPRGIGSPLDAWLVRSPAAVQGRGLLESPESPEHIPGPAAVPPSPVRRPPPSQAPAPSQARAGAARNHFLSMRRSGSISSARSLSLAEDFASNCSNDSFASESGGTDPVTELYQRGQEARARALYSHNLQVVRRSREPGLQVSSEGVQPARDVHGLTAVPPQQEPLAASQCQNIWTCLESVEDRRELARDRDEGWINALDLVTKVVDHSRYLPVAALHRVMEEALLEHEERMVRETALVTLLHCLDCRAAASTTSQYYLQLMSRVRPHVDPGPGRKWEFDIREPWLFLESLLERMAAAANTSRSSSATEPDTEEGEGGPGLLLRFLVTVLERDLAGWRQEHVESDSLTTEWRPLVAHVLFPSTTTSLWDKRLDRLCCLYSQAPCPALRSLVSLAAQVLACRERKTAGNEGKLRLASCLAQHLATAELDTERLGAELYLLQPSWLPALVTSALLSKMTGQQEGEVPSLRLLVNSFIDLKLETESKVDPTAAVTSTPRAKASSSQGAARSPLKALHSSPKPPRKINVTKKNKYGEIPLHGFAKKGNLAKMTECLLSPGIDVNSADNSGWTPLHEAVSSGKLEAVRLLLLYTPQNHTLERFFTPSKGALRKVDRVDVLSGDNETGYNPVHEAVISDDVEMVRLMLATVGEKVGFPTLGEVMAAQTKKGETLASLSRSQQMKDVLKSFTRGGRSRGAERENRAPLKLQVTDVARFTILLELGLTKYVAANSLGQVYGMYKHTKLDQVVTAAAEATRLLPNPEQEPYCGHTDLRAGLLHTQFGAKPRLDLFRSESTKSKDLKDFEQLLYYKKRLLKMGPASPALPALILLKAA